MQLSLLRRAPPARIEVFTMSFQWSLSALTLFERCKFAYKCRYVLKLPDPRPKGGPAQRGIDTHKTIEDHILYDHPLTFELQRAWGRAFTEIKKFDVQVEHKIGLTPAWVPQEDWKGSWLRMVLDLKAKKPGGYTVYDWKTGKEYPEHFDQKELYALGVLSEHPEEKSVSAVHVYLDSGRQTRREYHRDQLNARRARWDSRAQKLQGFVESPDTGQWIMEPNFLCKWCAYNKANKGPCRF